MPQPVDMPTEVSRLSQAERVQQVMDRASLAAQQRMASDVQESRIMAETQVQQTQTTPEQVEAEARRRNPYVRRRGKRGETAEADHNTAHADTAAAAPVIADANAEGKTFDISI